MVDYPIIKSVELLPVEDSNKRLLSKDTYPEEVKQGTDVFIKVGNNRDGTFEDTIVFDINPDFRIDGINLIL